MVENGERMVKESAIRLNKAKILVIFFSFADKSIFYDDVIRKFEAPKAKNIIFSYLARRSGFNFYMHKKNLNLY